MRNGRLASAMFAFLGILLSPLPVVTTPARAAQAALQIDIAYLREDRILPPVLSNLEPPPDDLGMGGADLAIRDDTTTGRFLNQNYALTVTRVAPGKDVIAVAKSVLAQTGLLLVDATAPMLQKIADLPEARRALIFNVTAEEPDLRSEGCRRNVLHAIPELSMRSDALMQVLKAKRWERLAMISGERNNDKLYAEALRKSATKFGLQLLAEKTWSFNTDLRLSASAEVPLLTQDFPDYDVLLVVDENDDFGDVIEHNSWLPRPVAGTSGLMADNWSPDLEQWGAVQLQQRFRAAEGRKILPRDFAGWIAVRAIGEAVTRTGSADPQTLRSYMLSANFRLDGFKGQPLSFRSWNGQMRQPMAVFNKGAVVDMAPLDAFLHEHDPLDTLGTDQPESACQAFGETP